MNEYLMIILFMITPPNRSYHADGLCDGVKVQKAYAIGGCTQWDSHADMLLYEIKVEAFKKLIGGKDVKQK